MTSALLLCALLAVTDGDTIVCRTDNGVERIRVAYLDCPEIGAPRGYAAALAMGKLLRGKIELKLRAQPGAVHPKCRRPGFCDHYGRTIGEVFANKKNVACRLIASGMCNRYVKYDIKGEYIRCEPRR